jgi:hypothetical protein
MSVDTESAVERRLALLEDRFALAELRTLFCQYTDEQRWDDLVSLFAEDGVLEIRDAVEGRAAIREFVGHLPEVWQFWWHFISNETAEIEGDSAEGVSYFNAPFAMDGASMNALGRYDDSFVRVDGEWKFSRRVLSFAVSAPVADGWTGEIPEGLRSAR